MRENWYDFAYLAERFPNGIPAIINGASPPDAPLIGTFAAGKATAAYTAHSYPTKVPPEAIVPFIEHYTSPGALVLDPFCGSGMTGLAAKRTGRRAILNDLSTLAMHLSYNHTEPCSPADLRKTWTRLEKDLRKVKDDIYGCVCRECRARAEVRYTVWSDVYECPACHEDLPLWKHGLDRNRGSVSRDLPCPSCGHFWRKTAAVRKRSEPAWQVYECSCSGPMRSQEFAKEDRDAYVNFKSQRAKGFFEPRTIIGRDREMYKRSALHLQGIESVRDFYTPRNLLALKVLWERIGNVQDDRVRCALAFAFTNTAWHGTRMRRFNSRGGHRPLTGTLYIPQISSEANVFEVFGHKIGQLERFYSELADQPISDTYIHRGTATNLDWIEDGSVDYIFTDPPFGSNIFYADCNIIGEAWLGQTTDTNLEAVVNKSLKVPEGGKSLEDYHLILARAFAEMHRVLKAGAWATVVFQSTDGRVWGAIEEAARAAGFEMHQANSLDKIQESMKGYKGRKGEENVASFDIVMTLRKTVIRQFLAPRELAPDQIDAEILTIVRQELTAVADDATQIGLTLPFLYTKVVKTLMNAGYSVRAMTMGSLRTLLARNFDEVDGCWLVRSESEAA